MWLGQLETSIEHRGGWQKEDADVTANGPPLHGSNSSGSLSDEEDGEEDGESSGSLSDEEDGEEDGEEGHHSTHDSSSSSS